MSRPYFTLVTRSLLSEDWAIEFGDYDAETVREQRSDMRYSAHIRGEPFQSKIIRTATDDQWAISAAVDALNGRNPDLVETPVHD